MPLPGLGWLGQDARGREWRPGDLELAKVAELAGSVLGDLEVGEGLWGSEASHDLLERVPLVELDVDLNILGRWAGIGGLAVRTKDF